ncbi:hypothetical protein DYB28_008949 [Aphanomyces astaci]|uniref:CYRIA/CYRIB Rac1 binding domain-containing protein n=1 Tax=Aphanomyces astaci TaxID=112090 RepID=A0A397EIN2_APHAT|nr:hypothetical protein DYB36_001554 [Aphanomyces astaci]RHY54573.1 hypothetical protein DYB38_000159 [Aphanomyces astaci]RHY62164.1 hypothetical protein DYB30_001539 [Aphanomyces astaci]RHY79767.1 hypothetical protein DYB31_000092 [Aphanomyces astaci]RLO10512.1 hypothetical protein DYB28_008949 [Aphanomyces astaci]
MTTGPGVPETDMSKVDGAVRELYVNATRLVEENKHTLSKIEDYKGYSLSHLIPNVELIQDFYNAAHNQGTTECHGPAHVHVGVVFHELQCLIMTSGSQAHPALYTRLADVLVFCLTFDTFKVGTTLDRSFLHHHVVVSFQATNPSIQNDLSHYRRYIAANKDNQSDLDGLDAATELYCLRAMTAAILVYDHTSEKGAFRTKSTVKQCVQALQAAKKGNAAVAPLQDCLQYLSRHFNDPQTPHRIRSMFE